MSEDNAMYHYTNPEGWNGIINGHKGYAIEHPITKKIVDSESVKGWMIPHRRVIPQGIESSLVPSEATSPAIFGLIEPTPASWLQYTDTNCVKVWDYLLGNCKKGKGKLVLLKLSLTDEDNPLVFDYAHVRRIAKDLSEIKNTEEYRKRLAEGNRDYWNSRVKLREYIGGFILPEVAVFAPIPIERIHFLWEKNYNDFLDECRGRRK